jgi:hypothetical protein
VRPEESLGLVRRPFSRKKRGFRVTRQELSRDFATALLAEARGSFDSGAPSNIRWCSFTKAGMRVGSAMNLHFLARPAWAAGSVMRL